MRLLDHRAEEAEPGQVALLRTAIADDRQRGGRAFEERRGRGRLDGNELAGSGCAGRGASPRRESARPPRARTRRAVPEKRPGSRLPLRPRRSASLAAPRSSRPREFVNRMRWLRVTKTPSGEASMSWRNCSRLSCSAVLARSRSASAASSSCRTSGRTAALTKSAMKPIRWRRVGAAAGRTTQGSSELPASRPSTTSADGREHRPHQRSAPVAEHDREERNQEEEDGRRPAAERHQAGQSRSKNSTVTARFPARSRLPVDRRTKGTTAASREEYRLTWPISERPRRKSRIAEIGPVTTAATTATRIAWLRITDSRPRAATEGGMNQRATRTARSPSEEKPVGRTHGPEHTTGSVDGGPSGADRTRATAAISPAGELRRAGHEVRVLGSRRRRASACSRRS